MLPPLIPCMMTGLRESLAELRLEVINVRYGPNAETIRFDFRGQTYHVSAPQDLLVVGFGEASQAWAVRQVLDRKAEPLD